MISNRFGSSVWRWLDRITGVAMLALAVAGLFLPAFMYAGLGCLRSEGQVAEGIGNALYFSVVTAATLGYGDIIPVNECRLIASVQVLSGLLLAGLGVAKIASVSGKAERQAIRRAQGTWIEPWLEDGTVMIAISEIRYADGILVYNGTNYSSDGGVLSTFRSILTACSDTTLEFHYHTVSGSTAHFQEGLAVLQFLANPRTGSWDKYVATVIDYGRMKKAIFEGRRASSDEEAIIHGRSHQSRVSLLRQCIDEVRPLPSESLL